MKSPSKEEILEVHVTKVISDKDIQRIHLTTNIADITVKKGKSSSIHIEFFGVKTAKLEPIFQVEENEKKLNIHCTYKDTHLNQFDFSTMKEQYKIKVILTIPNQHFEKIRFSSMTGNIKVNGSKTDLLHITTETGDITVDKTKAKEFVAHSNTGDIHLVSNVSGNKNIRTNTGNIFIHETALEHPMKLITTIGDVTIVARQCPTNASFDMRTTTGEIDLFGSRSERHLTKEIGIGSPLIEVHTRSGDIEVRCREI